MELEASIRRFRDELYSAASRHSFMQYDRGRDDYTRRPSSQCGGAFKNGWGRAQEVLKQGDDPCKPATLRRVTWWNLGYRFVMWRDAKRQEGGDRDDAYKVFKKVFLGRSPVCLPPPPRHGVEVPLPDEGNKAILLPQKPDVESFGWLRGLKIYFVWKEKKDVFQDNAKGRFT
jgi:hypothetical protein